MVKKRTTNKQNNLENSYNTVLSFLGSSSGVKSPSIVWQAVILNASTSRAISYSKLEINTSYLVTGIREKFSFYSKLTYIGFGIFKDDNEEYFLIYPISQKDFYNLPVITSHSSFIFKNDFTEHRFFSSYSSEQEKIKELGQFVLDNKTPEDIGTEYTYLPISYFNILDYIKEIIASQVPFGRVSFIAHIPQINLKEIMTEHDITSFDVASDSHCLKEFISYNLVPVSFTKLYDNTNRLTDSKKYFYEKGEPINYIILSTSHLLINYGEDKFVVTTI